MIFYLEEQPDKINDLLKSLTTKIDVSKAVSVVRNNELTLYKNIHIVVVLASKQKLLQTPPKKKNSFT